MLEPSKAHSNLPVGELRGLLGTSISAQPQPFPDTMKLTAARKWNRYTKLSSGWPYLCFKEQEQFSSSDRYYCSPGVARRAQWQVAALGTARRSRNHVYMTAARITMFRQCEVTDRKTELIPPQPISVNTLISRTDGLSQVSPISVYFQVYPKSIVAPAQHLGPCTGRLRGMVRTRPARQLLY